MDVVNLNNRSVDEEDKNDNSLSKGKKKDHLKKFKSAKLKKKSHITLPDKNNNSANNITDMSEIAY